MAANERPLCSAVWPGSCAEDDRKGDERSKEGGKEMRTQRGGCQTSSVESDPLVSAYSCREEGGRSVTGSKYSPFFD